MTLFYNDPAVRARLNFEHHVNRVEWKDMAELIERSGIGRVNRTTIAHFASGRACSPRVAKCLLTAFPPTVASEAWRLGQDVDTLKVALGVSLLSHPFTPEPPHRVGARLVAKWRAA